MVVVSAVSSISMVLVTLDSTPPGHGIGGPFLSQPCRSYWVLFLLLSQDVVLDAVVPPPTVFSTWKLGQICIFKPPSTFKQTITKQLFSENLFFFFL